MKLWLLLLPLDLINEISLEFDIDPDLVAAIVSSESNGKPCATRYEPKFNYLKDPKVFSAINSITHDTEVIHQKTSWGLMQVMGAVAREYGFDKPLVKLCDPRTGLFYGVSHLNKFLKKYNGTTELAVSAYNQGADYRDISGELKNKAYVEKVMSKYRYLKEI